MLLSIKSPSYRKLIKGLFTRLLHVIQLIFRSLNKTRIHLMKVYRDDKITDS